MTLPQPLQSIRAHGQKKKKKKTWRWGERRKKTSSAKLQSSVSRAPQTNNARRETDGNFIFYHFRLQLLFTIY